MKTASDIIEVQIERLPNWEVTETPPVIKVNEYNERISRVIQFMDERNFSHVIVYADREHFSNLEFLTGYDPRFEECLFIIPKYDIPVLIVGNEGMAYADFSPVKFKKVLYQHFSLQGQPREKSGTLEQIFYESGINSNSRIGVIGIKYRGMNGAAEELQYMDIPSYIADILRTICGREHVLNATDIMTHPSYGLRNVGLSSTEVALFEIAGTKASLGIENFLNNLKLGMTEMEASCLLQLDGSPLPVYPNVCFGMTNASYGLASPTYDKRAELRDPISFSNNRRRAMVARNGLLVRSKEDLSTDISDIVNDLYKPYFAALVNWYQTLGIGVAAGEVYKAVMDIIGTEKFGVTLNPGHQIHTDEWTNSPFFEGSTFKLQSGMALQCDIIASPGGSYFGIHVEDGVVLADKQLRNKVMEEFPASWERIVKRRQFINDVIGVNLPEEVLPTSNLQLILNPYILDTKTILAVKK